MDIGADQVDTDVKGVSDEEDHKEHDDVAGERGDGVEDHADDAAGQHERHQTGIRKDIRQPAGDVIERSDTTHEFFDDTALFMPSLGQDERQRTQDEDQGGVTEDQDGDAGEDDPPGHHVKDALQGFVIPEAI